MAKIRVHELAKEMGLNSRDLVQQLQDLGIQVKNHFSTLEEAEVANFKKRSQKESSPSASKQSGQREEIKRETEAKPHPAKPESKMASAETRSQPSKKSAGAQTPKSGPPRPEDRGADRRMTSSREDGVKREPGSGPLPRESSQQPAAGGASSAAAPGSGRAAGERPATGRSPAGERYAPQRPPGERQPMNRPPGERQPSGRPQGERTTAQRPSGDRQPLSRSASDRQPQSRPPGDRQPQSRPVSDRTPTGRSPGERPATGRPPGDRQPLNRPTGERQPQSRPSGERQPYSRPPGDRTVPQRPPGDRQPISRPPGDRQTQSRPPGGRPATSRPPGDRSTGSYGDRPASRPTGSRPGSPRPAAASPAPAKPTGRATERDKPKTPGDSFQSRGAGKGLPAKKSDPKRPVNRPPSGRDRVVSLADDEIGSRGRKKPGRASGRGSRGKAAPRVTAPSLPKSVIIGKSVTIQDLAGALNRTSADLIKRLIALGVMVTATQTIDFDTAAIVCSELGVDAQPEITQEEALIPDIVDDPAIQIERPPVVTVMGHVDHGKTSLLDAIRKTKVTESEAGGITQHIGAYQVEINGRKITFIDTPGHEAFTSMRARGARVTDIAILVVAADDGVMPQTIEAINHARAAEVPIIVAINKIDKPTANPERIKQQLTEYGLLAEDWGGDTICVPVSAHSREGLDALLEMILLVAEMGNIQANPDRPALGTVIEGQLDKGRGPVATVLVQHGTLRVGDSVLVGLTYGKVRAMLDHRGEWLKEAAPSTPVEVLGLDGVPMAGDILRVVSEEKIARQITESRQDQRREEEMHKSVRVTLDDLFKQIKEGQIKELNLIIKGDVQGSIEALRQSLEKLSTDEVRVNMVHTGVGTINENDVMLAAASNAIIIGFNVRPDHNTRRAAEQEQVDIRLYRVIYEAVNDVRDAMSGLLDPDWKEVVLGRAEVRATFKVPKAGMIAGCYVLDGKMVKGAEVRVLRDGVVIQEGKIDSLRRFKDDVKEVLQSFECGIGIEKFNDVKEGDIFEDYMMERVERSL